MDILNEQVNTLTTKVDTLSQQIEELSTKVSGVVAECRFGTDQIQRSDSGSYSSYRSQIGQSSLSISMEHKDVLVDSTNPDTSTQGEKQLTPEIQIQRLTAQLTAAYNRIAALEEQLLSQRVH